MYARDVVNTYTSNLDTVLLQGSLVEKLVSGRIAKQPFIDQEGSIVRKKQDALEKIMNIIKAF